MKKKQKPGPKGPRKDSQASLIRKLILEGKSDAQIKRSVLRKFPKAKLITSSGKSMIKWYRWQLRSKGLTK